MPPQVEKLLGEVQPLSRAAAAAGAFGEEGASAPALPAEALEGQCRLLDRVCSEVSRLNFFSAKGQVMLFAGNGEVTNSNQPLVRSARAKLFSAEGQVGRSRRPV